MKLETSKERYNSMMELFRRATKLNHAFKAESEKDGVEFGDVITLLGQIQNLTAMDELISTEMALEEVLVDMLNLPCDSEESRRNFVAAYGKGVHVFLKDVLLRRINVSINMSNPDIVTDDRLVKFQKDMHETMIALRKRYKVLYKI